MTATHILCETLAPDDHNSISVTFILLLIGYGIGLFAGSNIVLPLLWSWPKSRRLYREGRLTAPIPLINFVAAPTLWTLLVLASIWIVSRVYSEGTVWYVVGLVISGVQAMRLLFKPNDDMDADFARTFETYLVGSETPDMSTNPLPFFAEHAPGSIGARLLRVTYSTAQIVHIASTVASTDQEKALNALKAVTEMVAGLYAELAAIDAALPAGIAGLSAPDVLRDDTANSEDAHAAARVRLVREVYAKYRAQAGVK